MSDKELVGVAISQYMDLLRIDKADNMESVKKEVRNQKRELKARLEAMGVTVEDLTIE